MSLRDKILNVVTDFDSEGTDIDMLKRHVNDIMNVIEIEIDSVRELKDDHNYSGDDEFIDGFDLGFDHALTKLKEILK